MSRRYILNAEEEAKHRRALRFIAPSRYGLEYWEGSYGETDRFSGEQRRAMVEQGRDIDTAEIVEVIAPARLRLHITVLVGLSPQSLDSYSRRLACPVIGRRGDRLRVISPSGAQKLVYPDGSLTRAKARRAA